MLRLLGLGVRSRGVIVGVEQVRDAAKRGKLVLAVVAADASPHSTSKVVPLLVARRVDIVKVDSAAVLGRAVGREQTVADAAKRGKLVLAVVAADASPHSTSKVVPLLVATH